MRLSELRPCDKCGGAIAPIFTVVKFSPAVINPEATNGVLGLNQMFGGHALGLAEVMAPDPDGAVKVTGEINAEMYTTLFLCTACYCHPVNLAALAEQLADKRAK